ncbi:MULTISPECIES: hypothetical protein [unclassified Streptomyces]|uniref:hypothetical protein n=1 Tax=unclassified Streptomyces TaxID=2593676 RepID=UPI002DD95F30|nr:hypothetical protein [Streptomyces sp. NBC_01766]WSC23334.1 hypothetical protein OIE60_28700 [Streptomyces sp. NBC_01766]WSV57245.1 hypothetical protein OG282_28125 [Streptomyces sp. NBC_01014]
MKRIGVTGHRNIPLEAAVHVRDSLHTLFRGQTGALRALSSLAAGADQLFAGIALEHGAELTAVIPSDDYELGFDDTDELARYHWLRGRATQEIRMDFPHSTDDAYYAAGTYIADNCDQLVAVWDGRPARGLGGTGDIVNYALKVGKPVTVIWRDGVERD